MTQLPVGKYWCFAENAHLIEDTYILSPTDDTTTERLRYTFQYGLLILPPVSSLLAICNSVGILRDCIRHYCLNGPYLIAYCILKLISAALVWIMALPRFMQVSFTPDAGRRVSAKIPTLIMTQQAFRLAATWLFFFLLVFQVLALARLTRSIASKYSPTPHLNAIHTKLSLVEFVSWLPVNAQSNLHRLSWVRRDERGTNVWIWCEIIMLTGDVLVQIILLVKILLECASCSQENKVDLTSGHGDTNDLQISRHYTSEATEYGVNGLIQLYSSQIDSQKLANRKSVLHVRMSPPPLPSPDYAYGAFKMPSQEGTDSPSLKFACFQRDNVNNTTNTTASTTNSITSPTANTALPFFYAFPDHEDHHQSQFTTTEEYFDAHGVLVSRL
ncbi:unnamed protein product [Hydatigera taeniaeformis]|uniref:DUF1421 multi-domain protein n=1 Tax=Hydatigena taeniaeformis TaxID=6205 RepID=A0A0R3WM17_HYDTA|nr:unnamed protein product [Hydatigera taeniaeformis]